MKLKYLMLGLLLALTGCTPMTYEEVQGAKQYCQSRNMTYQIDTAGGQPRRVWCKDAEGNYYQVLNKDSK